MLYISVPQRSRLKISYEILEDTVDLGVLLHNTAAAMDQVTPGAVHVPLSSEREDSHVVIWIVRLPYLLTERIRSSSALRTRVSNGPVSVVVVGTDEFAASLVPPKDVAYLDANGRPVTNAMQLTAYTRDAILQEKNVSVKSENG